MKSIRFGSSPLTQNWKHFVNNIEKIYVSHFFMKHSSSCQKILFPPLEILFLVKYNQSMFSLWSYHCKIVLTYLISLHQKFIFTRSEIDKQWKQINELELKCFSQWISLLVVISTKLNTFIITITKINLSSTKI